MRLHRFGPVAAPAVFAVLGLGLAGCEGGTFTGDLATDAPADPDIVEVRVSLRGVRFRQSGGGTTTLEFNDPEPVDLLTFADGDPLRLFTDESLADGNYTGVRLIFEDEDDVDGTVVDAGGGEFPVVLDEGAYADVGFTVTDDESNSHALTLVLDLRQSLSFDDSEDEYTLTPVLRAVKTDKAGRITGLVTFDCPDGESLERGGAVYLFQGRDVEPDDLDGAGAEPHATTRVRHDSSTGDFGYALRHLAPGDYTLALTCEGDEEELGVDDGLSFRKVRNLSLRSDESLELDLD
ncbi:MAG TPA: DUF4382 domain-containing protein [Steroidobacteraceae bacterium]|nr:DUF4382 domain-containing protein [Steroidobacteraceae bacterium]